MLISRSTGIELLVSVKHPDVNPFGHLDTEFIRHWNGLIARSAADGRSLKKFSVQIDLTSI